MSALYLKDAVYWSVSAHLHSHAIPAAIYQLLRPPLQLLSIQAGFWWPRHEMSAEILVDKPADDDDDVIYLLRVARTIHRNQARSAVAASAARIEARLWRDISATLPWNLVRRREREAEHVSKIPTTHSAIANPLLFSRSFTLAIGENHYNPDGWHEWYISRGSDATITTVHLDGAGF
jgi:hypothetical protein